jgi:hypothetical protein
MSCGWSSFDGSGPLMPEPTQRQIEHLIHLVGLPTFLTTDETEKSLIREAYRGGWEAAQFSHDMWIEREAQA